MEKVLICFSPNETNIEAHVLKMCACGRLNCSANVTVVLRVIELSLGHNIVY